ncbi:MULTISPECIES: hypothetical protein [Sorangium]|uniref:hypothetical protein n=1 Tax=Sorangium TaxID=39643 RepID=UPI003D9C6509
MRGEAECTIVAAGSETAFGKSKALLESMAGIVTYLGQRVGACRPSARTAFR